jgi:tripartite-type tricarboxylate transporter receptor subunit TctC
MQRVIAAVVCAAFALGLAGGAGGAMAQSGYPRKPILMLVPLFPDVPTVSEAGLPGFEFTSWFGIVVPARHA